MAPELYEESYDCKVDIYSFGLCVLELFTHEFPYSECENMAQIYKKVSQGKPPAGLDKVTDDEMREFVKLCIDKDPNKRPSARELLAHQYLRAVDKDKAAAAPSSSTTSAASQPPPLPPLPPPPPPVSVRLLPVVDEEECPTPEGDPGASAQEPHPLAPDHSMPTTPTSPPPEELPQSQLPLPPSGASASSLAGSSPPGALDEARFVRAASGEMVRVKGQWVRGEAMVSLRLRMVTEYVDAATSETKARDQTVQFRFSLLKDSAEEVAREMVQEFGLPTDTVEGIRTHILYEIRRLVGKQWVEHTLPEGMGELSERAGDSDSALSLSAPPSAPPSAPSSRPPSPGSQPPSRNISAAGGLDSLADNLARGVAAAFSADHTHSAPTISIAVLPSQQPLMPLSSPAPPPPPPVIVREGRPSSAPSSEHSHAASLSREPSPVARSLAELEEDGAPTHARNPSLINWVPPTEEIDAPAASAHAGPLVCGPVGGAAAAPAPSRVGGLDASAVAAAPSQDVTQQVQEWRAAHATVVAVAPAAVPAAASPPPPADFAVLWPAPEAPAADAHFAAAPAAASASVASEPASDLSDNDPLYQELMAQIAQKQEAENAILQAKHLREKQAAAEAARALLASGHRAGGMERQGSTSSFSSAGDLSALQTPVPSSHAPPPPPQSYASVASQPAADARPETPAAAPGVFTAPLQSLSPTLPAPAGAHGEDARISQGSAGVAARSVHDALNAAAAMPVSRGGGPPMASHPPSANGGPPPRGTSMVRRSTDGVDGETAEEKAQREKLALEQKIQQLSNRALFDMNKSSETLMGKMGMKRESSSLSVTGSAGSAQGGSHRGDGEGSVRGQSGVHHGGASAMGQSGHHDVGLLRSGSTSLTHNVSSMSLEAAPASAPAGGGALHHAPTGPSLAHAMCGPLAQPPPVPPHPPPPVPPHHPHVAPLLPPPAPH